MSAFSCTNNRLLRVFRQFMGRIIFLKPYQNNIMSRIGATCILILARAMLRWLINTNYGSSRHQRTCMYSETCSKRPHVKAVASYRQSLATGIMNISIGWAIYFHHDNPGHYIQVSLYIHINTRHVYVYIINGKYTQIPI